MKIFDSTLIYPIFDVESIDDVPRVPRAHLEVVFTSSTDEFWTSHVLVAIDGAALSRRQVALFDSDTSQHHPAIAPWSSHHAPLSPQVVKLETRANRARCDRSSRAARGRSVK